MKKKETKKNNLMKKIVIICLVIILIELLGMFVIKVFRERGIDHFDTLNDLI
jgi:hypothetical protein